MDAEYTACCSGFSNIGCRQAGSRPRFPFRCVPHTIYNFIMPSKLQQDIKQSKPFANIESEVYLNIVLLAQELGSPVKSLLKTAGLSPAQYNVLRILRGAGDEGLTCSEVGKRMVHRVPDVTRILDRLECRGLIARRRRDDDRRVVCAQILPAGQTLIDPLDGPIATVHANTLGAMPPEQLHALRDLLDAARTAVGKAP